jgi:hypothetical protein
MKCHLDSPRNAFLGSLEHNDAHTPRKRNLPRGSSNAMGGSKTRARKKKSERRLDATAGEAFPRLPDHLVVEHILRSENFDDPADLARLPAVSRAMRDAVAATGLQFKELHEWEAMDLGCLSALQRLQRRGRPAEESLCSSAATFGQLEVLQWAREIRCPWDEATCRYAAHGGHLNVLQWASANGCPWDEYTCSWAAGADELEALRWAHENGCPWDEEMCACAAGFGNMELLQWARANGCPWD